VHTKLWSESLKKRDLSDSLDVERKIILYWILMWEGVGWTNSNEPPASLKGGEFVDYLNYY
jgi:hypothetical protein